MITLNTPRKLQYSHYSQCPPQLPAYAPSLHHPNTLNTLNITAPNAFNLINAASACNALNTISSPNATHATNTFITPAPNHCSTLKALNIFTNLNNPCCPNSGKANNPLKTLHVLTKPYCLKRWHQPTQPCPDTLPLGSSTLLSSTCPFVHIQRAGKFRGIEGMEGIDEIEGTRGIGVDDSTGCSEGMQSVESIDSIR